LQGVCNISTLQFFQQTFVDGCGEIGGIFIVHPLGELNQFSHQTLGLGDFFVASATTLAMAAFCRAVIGAWIEFHGGVIVGGSAESL
jgi:hypothetical protein